MTFETRALKPRIGSEVEIDVSTLLSGQHADELRTLLEARGILLFRGINLDKEQQLAFSSTLGTVYTHGGSVVDVSLDKTVMAAADYFKTSFYWHFDGFVDAIPPRASLLSACVLSSTGGGDTEFANTYAAYADLPQDEKDAYDKVKVVHSFEANQLIANPVPSYQTWMDWRRLNPHPKIHPLIWHHKSGRNSLLIGTTASHIDGMSWSDGRGLLIRLLDWATQPEYVYRHTWEVGDLIVYDNTGSLHRVLPYEADSGRLMRRTKLVGEEGVA